MVADADEVPRLWNRMGVPHATEPSGPWDTEHSRMLESRAGVVLRTSTQLSGQRTCDMEGAQAPSAHGLQHLGSTLVAARGTPPLAQ